MARAAVERSIARRPSGARVPAEERFPQSGVRHADRTQPGPAGAGSAPQRRAPCPDRRGSRFQPGTSRCRRLAHGAHHRSEERALVEEADLALRRMDVDVDARRDRSSRRMSAKALRFAGRRSPNALPQRGREPRRGDPAPVHEQRLVLRARPRQLRNADEASQRRRRA